MNHAGQRGKIDQPVQALPFRESQPAHPARCGRNGQRQQQREAQHTHRDEAPLHHIGPHVGQAERFVQDEPRHKMQADVEEGEEAQHAAIAYQLGLIEDLAQRRHHKRDEQEADGPVAGVVRDVFHRIAGQLRRVARG